ncbi:hypothetical protein NQZ68_038995 [Dissostichus eleginoides]|nr:hypothetical protein NQZ68_038995 [Dissostichus eleginoides]
MVHAESRRGGFTAGPHVLSLSLDICSSTTARSSTMVPAQDGWENKGLQDLFLITLSPHLCFYNRAHVNSPQPGEAVHFTPERKLRG